MEPALRLSPVSDFRIAGGLWDGRTLYDLYGEAQTPFEWHDSLFRRARELDGLEQITLVASANLPAQRLYKALGFESYGIEPHSLKIDEEYVDDMLMILRF